MAYSVIVCQEGKYMSLYYELSTSIEEVMNRVEETPEFKKRLSKLIENYFDNSYQDNDISELIELVEAEEPADGH